MNLLNNSKVHVFISIITIIYYFILKKYDKSNNALLLSLYIPIIMYGFIYIITNTNLIVDTILIVDKPIITEIKPSSLIEMSDLYPTSNSV